MKQKLFIMTICLIATLKMMAQEFTLQGRVTDDDNNPVELATVSVASQGKVAFTSLRGEFSMHLHSADSVAVKFSMIGYKTKVRVLRRPRGKQTLQVILHANATMLGDVNVTGEKIQSDQTQEIKVKDIRMAPSANGNAAKGIIDLCQQAGATLEGMGFIIEKAFQDGGKYLRDSGVRVESLAIIESLDNCEIKIKDDGYDR